VPDSRRVAGWLVAALALALAVRLPRVLEDDFPINDGGVFCVMAAELADAGLVPPAFTDYNRAHIPFAYPPLALVVTAALHRATGWSLLGLLRFLPLLTNLAAIAAFLLLAKRVLGSPLAAGLAALLFAVLPRSYEFLIAGGGLTRGFGFLFAMLALAAGHDLLVGNRRRAALPAAVWSGLAILSHPEMGLFALVGLAVTAAATGITRRRLGLLAGVAAAAALIAAPWWVTVLSRHGLQPFLGASATADWRWGSLLRLASPELTGERGLAPIACLALLALLTAVRGGRLLLPGWLLAAYAVVPRSAPTLATIPVALLAARALTDVVLPAFAPSRANESTRGRARSHAAMALVLAGLLTYTLVVSNLRRTSEQWPAMRRVSPAERSAMAWVAANTSGDARFLVASTARSWWADPVDSWFPVLAQRASVATANGAEWLPGGEFRRRLEAYSALKQCQVVDAACVEAWSTRFGTGFTNVWVSKPAGATTGAAGPAGGFEHHAGFVVVYDGPGATVIARRGLGSESGAPGRGPGNGDR
jgi:hypothetical protein